MAIHVDEMLAVAAQTLPMKYYLRERPQWPNYCYRLAMPVLQSMYKFGDMPVDIKGL